MPGEQPLVLPVAIGGLELALRIGLALVLGTLVGIEREWHHKNAGIRTHALLAVGAAAYSLISLLGYGPTNNPMQLAAGVVTGIGFIGAGVIMHRGTAVQGITTATTLWTTASLGLALGAGYYVLTALVFGAIITVQFPLRWLEERIDRRAPAPPR